MQPTEPADLAYCGLIGPDDVSQAQWNMIARENGWPIVLNQGQQAQALYRGKQPEPILGAAAKPQCAYAGCGRWVAAGAEHCSEHAPAVELEPAMPF